MTNKTTTQKIGNVGVDSGQLLVCDPCYFEHEWRKEKKNENIFDPQKKGEFSYAGCCIATTSKQQGGQLNFKIGHTGAGVAFATGFGDGNYPVFAKLKDYGTKEQPDVRVKEVIIKFIED